MDCHMLLKTMQNCCQLFINSNPSHSENLTEADIISIQHIILDLSTFLLRRSGLDTSVSELKHDSSWESDDCDLQNYFKLTQDSCLSDTLEPLKFNVIQDAWNHTESHFANEMKRSHCTNPSFQISIDKLNKKNVCNRVEDNSQPVQLVSGVKESPDSYLDNAHDYNEGHGTSIYTTSLHNLDQDTVSATQENVATHPVEDVLHRFKILQECCNSYSPKKQENNSRILLDVQEVPTLHQNDTVYTKFQDLSTSKVTCTDIDELQKRNTYKKSEELQVKKENLNEEASGDHQKLKSSTVCKNEAVNTFTLPDSDEIQRRLAILRERDASQMQDEWELLDEELVDTIPDTVHIEDAAYCQVDGIENIAAYPRRDTLPVEKESSNQELLKSHQNLRESFTKGLLYENEASNLDSEVQRRLAILQKRGN